MDYDEIKKMLNKMDIPVAYWCFDKSDVPALPFMVFSIPSYNVFYADGESYQKASKLYIELYTEYKDIELEGKLENIFKGYGINASKEEQYLQDEKMFVEIYEMEV